MITVEDLNCPQVNWNAYQAPPNEISHVVSDFSVSNSNVQYFNEPALDSYIVDVVLTNEPNIVTRIIIDSFFSTSDHTSVNFDQLFEAINAGEVPSKKKVFFGKKQITVQLTTDCINAGGIRCSQTTSPLMTYGRSSLKCSVMLSAYSCLR